jgi:hypothetical protein
MPVAPIFCTSAPLDEFIFYPALTSFGLAMNNSHELPERQDFAFACLVCDLPKTHA